MLNRVNKEKFRYSLIIAALLHIALFFALFLTLHHSSKLLFQAPPPLQVIHATAVPIESVLKKPTLTLNKIKPSATAVTKLLSKPILLEKSPVLLPSKEKKQAKTEKNQLIPLKIPDKSASLTKNIVAKINPTKLKVSKTKKTLDKVRQQKLFKESLRLVEKNVQQLLDQEIKSLAKQQINVVRNAETIDKYRHLILQAIAQQWIIPPKMKKHLETKLAVHLAPGGMVLEVVIIKSSGNTILDRSAQTAVYKASPLPIPKHNSLFHTFQKINLTVRPEDVITQ